VSRAVRIALVILAATVSAASLIVPSNHSARRMPAQPGAIQHSAVTQAECRKLLARLPRVLGNETQTSPAGSNPVAYGTSHATVWCGISRPAGLTPISQLYEIGGIHGGSVAWLVSDDNTLYTAVDRSVFVALQVSADEDPDLPELSEAIASALPRVCTHVHAQLAGSKLPLCSARQ
jgi:uncharacterized protein DUF3515